MFRFPLPFFNPDDKMVTKLKELHHQLHIIRSPLMHVTSDLLRQLNETDRLISTLSRYAKETPEWQHHSLDHKKYGISADTYCHLRKAVRQMYPSVMWSTIAYEMRLANTLDLQMSIYNAALAFTEEMPMNPIEFLEDDDNLPPYAIVCRSFEEFNECEMRNKAYVDHLKMSIKGLTDKDAVKQQILIAFNATSNCEAQMLVLYTGAHHLHFIKAHNIMPRPPRWLNNFDEYTTVESNQTEDDDVNNSALAEVLDFMGDDFSVEDVSAAIDKMILDLERNDENNVCILYIREKHIPTAAAIISEHLNMTMDEVEKKLCNTPPIYFHCPSEESASQLKERLDDICLCG